MERMLYTYGIMVLTTAVGFAGYEFIDWRTLDSDNWAAWVQAIGSISAIAVAIYVPAAQRRKELDTKEREYWEERRYQANRILPLLTDTLFFLQETYKASQPLADSILLFRFERERCQTLLADVTRFQRERLSLSEFNLLGTLKVILQDTWDAFKTTDTLAIHPGTDEDRYGLRDFHLRTKILLDVCSAASLHAIGKLEKLPA